MGERSVRTGGRRYRRARSLRRGRRAVVSVVGTLLALLVFFALFGVFLTQYVPLWMTDNESTFTSDTENSMATLKSNIDLQAALGAPPVYGTPFVMASQGIALIAQPTPATLNFVPQLPGVFANVSMTVGPGGGGAFYQNFSLGSLTASIPNRYYSPQTFEFEDDAVIQSQTDTQQVVDFAPLFAINVSGSVVGVSVVLLQLVGNATQVVSTGTAEVFTHFLHAQEFNSNGGGSQFNARVFLGTHFPCAWTTFLFNLLSHSGASGHWTLGPSSVCFASAGKPTDLTVQFTSISSFTLVVATFGIVVGVGVE